MNNKKSTKRALLSSVLSLVLCMAMLIGTTFAWFTDSVTSSGNKIQAGTLKVDLEVLNKDTNTWSSVKDTEEAIFSYDNWEPGYTEVKVLKVENEGTLALKWHARLVSKNKMSDLANVIDVYVKEGATTYPDSNNRELTGYGYRKVGTLANFINTISDTTNGMLTADNKSATLGLAFKMQESAGNEYQGASLGEFDIQILATQLSSEADSFDIYYDENANFFNVWDGSVDSGWYDASESTYIINSAAELAGLAQLVNNGNSFAGKTVKLGADIDLDNLPWTPIGIKGSSFGGTFDGNGYVIANLNVTGTERVGLIGCAGNSASIYNVNIVNATVEGNHYVGAVLGYGYLSANSLAGCTVENATVIANPDSNNDNGDKAGVIAGMAINGNIYNNKAINSKVYAYRDFGGIVGCAQAENRDIKVYDNTVEDVTLTYIYCDNYAGGKTNQNMNDHVGRENPTGYKVTAENNEGTANKVGGTAAFASDSAALADAIKSEATTIILENSEYTFTNLSSASGKTITGGDGTKVVPASGSSSALTGTVDNLIVKNITFEGSNAARWTYTKGDVVFEDCVFSGDVYGYHVDDAYNGTITFNNCEFIGFNAFAATGTYYFNSCKFAHSGSYGHTNMWGVGYFNNCTFGDKASFSPSGSGKTYVNGVEETYHHEFIGTAASLVAFADSVNVGKDSWKGQKVLLVADIDLEGIDWEPIGQTGATEFRGIFDGQNHTIKNLYIDSSEHTDEHYSSGLFGWAEAGVTIKNVNVDGATVKGNHNVAVIVGYTYSGKISGCNVSNATVVCNHANDDACGDKAGTIAGYTADEARISDCSATDCTVTAGRDAGQLLGLGYSKSISNCTANNVEVTATGECTGANINNASIGRVMK